LLAWILEGAAMSDLYPIIVNVRVKVGSERERLVREALRMYGLSDSDTTALFDRLLGDLAGMREFNRRLDVEIAEKDKEIAELRGRRFGGMK
jgi:hypothetical protein